MRATLGYRGNLRAFLEEPFDVEVQLLHQQRINQIVSLEL